MKAFALMQLKLYSSSSLSRCFSWRLLQLMSLPRPGRDRTKEFWKEWTWDKATFLLKRFCVDGGWPWSDERWTQLPRVTANQDFFFLLLLLLPSNWNGSAPTRLKKDWVCNNTWWKLFFSFSPFNLSFYFLFFFFFFSILFLIHPPSTCFSVSFFFQKDRNNNNKWKLFFYFSPFNLSFYF